LEIGKGNEWQGSPNPKIPLACEMAFIEGVEGGLGEGEVACGPGKVTEFLSSCL